jgi:hypothetical protein
MLKPQAPKAKVGLISNTQPHDALNREHRKPIPHAMATSSTRNCHKTENPGASLYFVEEEYLVTALVPSETACLASSPGRIRRTLQRVSGTDVDVRRNAYEVWISRDEMVDFLV